MSITRIPSPEYPPQKKRENDLSKEGREQCRKIAVMLGMAFTWAETAEGCDFWDGVCDRLVAISKGEVLK